MRSSRGWKKWCRSPILSPLLVFVGDVLEVADAFLQLAFALVGEPFRLLLAVAGQRSELLAHLAGDVLHMALGLVLVHKALLSRTKVSAAARAGLVPTPAWAAPRAGRRPASPPGRGRTRAAGSSSRCA